jgi:hypothetical protein
MAPGTLRLQLIASFGADAMGTYWHAYDLARGGMPVQVHELQGSYAQWRPATLPGYELVEEGGRALVILPSAPVAPPSAAPPLGAPAVAASAPPARKSGGRWLIVGVVGFVVLAVTAVTLAFVLAPAGPSSSASPRSQYEPVNTSLIGIDIGECVRLTTTDWTDPLQEINASRAQCRSASDIRVVRSTHESIPRDQARDKVGLCEANAAGKRLAAWASATNLTGTLVCLGEVPG